jgi:hypothetical protein
VKLVVGVGIVAVALLASAGCARDAGPVVRAAVPSTSTTTPAPLAFAPVPASDAAGEPGGIAVMHGRQAGGVLLLTGTVSGLTLVAVDATGARASWPVPPDLLRHSTVQPGLVESSDGMVFLVGDDRLVELDPRSGTLTGHVIPPAKTSTSAMAHQPEYLRSLIPASAVAASETTVYVVLSRAAELVVFDRAGKGFSTVDLGGREALSVGVGSGGVRVGLRDQATMTSSIATLTGTALTDPVTVLDSTFVRVRPTYLMSGSQFPVIVHADRTVETRRGGLPGLAFPPMLEGVQVQPDGSMVAAGREEAIVLAPPDQPDVVVARVPYPMRPCLTGPASGPGPMPGAPSTTAGPSTTARTSCPDVPRHLVVDGTGRIWGAFGQGPSVLWATQPP